MQGFPRKVDWRLVGTQGIGYPVADVAPRLTSCTRAARPSHGCRAHRVPLSAAASKEYP